MSTRVWFSLLYVLMISLAHTQVNEIKTLTGEIINNDIDKSGIVILNKSTGGTTISDVNGFFKIGVRLNDSIYLRSLQIKAHLIFINENIFKSDSLRVYLEQKVNQLSNVTVTPHNLSGNILADANRVNKTEVLNFDDFGIPGFKGIRKEKIAYKNNAQILLNVLLLPVMPLNIEGIYKQLSGYYKNLKMARGLEVRYNTIESVIQFYGVKYFQERYKLEIDEIYEFILGATENFDLENDFKNSNHGLILSNLDIFYESINN